MASVFFGSSRIKPKGFTTYKHTIRVSPMNTFSQTQTNELIKFQWRTRNHIDSQGVYFVITISAEAGDLGGTQLLLDKSANAIIASQTIYCDNKLVEQQNNLSDIMGILEDVTVTDDGRMNNQQMGFQPRDHPKDTIRAPANYQGSLAGQTYMTSASGGASTWSIQQTGYIGTNRIPWSQLEHDNYIDNEHMNVQGASTFGYNTASAPYIGIGTRVALIGNLPHLSAKYLQSVAGFGTYSLNLPFIEKASKGQRCEALEAISTAYGCQGSNKPTIVYNDATDNFMNSAQDTDNRKHVNKTHRSGYLNYHSDQSCESPCVKLDPTYGKSYIYKGQIQDKPVPSNHIKLIVPCNSGVFGALLPEHKFIPGDSLQNVEVQIRLNPYAFFTSGLHKDADIEMTDIAGTPTKVAMGDLSQYLIARKWKIEDCEMMIDTFQFDPTFTQQLESQLAQGITLRSNGFEYSQSITVPDSRYIQGSHQINTGVQSLRGTFFYVEPDDYQKWSYCRKNFRINGGITSWQLKMNQDYYPRQPVQGHTGTPFADSVDQADNQEFITFLQQQFGLHNKVDQAMPVINNVNYAINSRSYDPDCSKVTGSNYLVDSKDWLLNGRPGQEEQRYVGTALQYVNYSSYPSDPESVQGIDSNKYKPFDILIKTDQNNYFPRQCTLKILNHFNIEVTFSPGKVNVIGYM